MALFRSLQTAFVQRAFETTTERALTAGLQAGDDDNALATRVLQSVAGENSALVALAKTVPGFQFAAHAVLAGVGEFLGDHADQLWPGDNRPQINALRRVLKHVGPALVGVTNATADVIESKVNGTISVSTVPRSNRKAALDAVYVSSELPDRILIPARDAHGEIRMDGDYPIFLDREAIQSKARWQNAHQATTRKEGSGKNSKTISVQAVKWPLIGPMTILEAFVCVEHHVGRDVEAIKKLLTPSTGEQWSPETWDVIRAYNTSCAEFERNGTFDWVDHEQGEGLVETLKEAKAKGKITAREVHELVGVAFRNRIGQDGARAGRLSFDAVAELEGQAFDKWLGGEQPAYTKVVRAVQRIRRSAAQRGVSGLQVAVMIATASWIIWLPVVACVAFLMLAVRWYLAGLLGSDGANLLTGHDAMWLTIKSGVVAFAVTWFFPVFQTATGWTRSLLPALKEDWLVDIGRRIAAFGLVICTGVTTYAIMLNVPPDVRAIVPVSALVGVGVGIGLVAAGYRSQAEEIIAKSAVPTMIAFGVLPLVIAFFYGSYLGNPKVGLAVVAGITSYVADSKWLQLALLLSGLLVVSGILSLFEYRKVPDEIVARLRVRGAGILITGIAVALIAHVCFSGPAKASVAPQPVTYSAPAPVEEPRRKSICDEKISFYQREQLGCDN